MKKQTYLYLNKKKIFITVSLLLSVAGFCNNVSSKSKAELHPLVHNGTLTNPYESMVIGNGDIAISAQMFSHELILQIGKNDIWDSRSERLTKDQLITHDALVEADGDVKGLYDFSNVHSTNYTGNSRLGPAPKPAGQIIISHPGLSNTKISGKVDISTGILTVEYGFPEGTLSIEVFVHKEKNLILSKYSTKGKVPWFTIVVEKAPDYVDTEMPDPVISNGHNDRQFAITQTIKANHGVPDFSWHLGCAFAEGIKGVEIWNALKWRYALEQRLSLPDNTSVVMAVGVATDRDGDGNSLERALKLSDNVTSTSRYEEEKTAHINSWESFWSKSSIELEDKELEALWYRTMFGFASCLGPDAQAPGLNANIPIYDFSAWNGYYTWNHNVQKWFFPALTVNHPEWYNALATLIDQHIPVFEYLAQEVFGLEGVYIDLGTFPFAPADRALSYSTFGRALSHTGWISQMLYQHYEYTNDTEWLRENAYSYLSKAADFYANYMDKYQKKDLVIYPSMLLEDTDAWEKGFPEGKNVLTDLIYFRKAFEGAIHASELLKIDSKKRDRWKRMLKRVPDVEYGWKDGRGWFSIYKDWQNVWPDFDKYVYHVQTSRWGCSGWLVFPGEYIDGDEKSGLAPAVRDMLAGTDLLNLPDKTRQLGTFHGEANFLPFIRMGIMEKYDDLRTLLLNHRFESGQFSPFSTGENVYVRNVLCKSWRIVENQYFPILGIAEMLMQSQGNVIRLFPYWPMKQSASFDGLRARNGFVISASWNPQSGLSAKITSLNGNMCSIRWDKDELPVIKQNGKPVNFTKKGRDIVFKTQPLTEYELTTSNKYGAK